jgi:hypothetical protein
MRIVYLFFFGLDNMKIEEPEQDKIQGAIHYFTGKLGGINYSMAIHEGDANKRLASQAENIFRLSQIAVPEKYRKEFEKLHKLIEATLDSINFAGLTPVRITGIRNSTASKYIKLLLEIEEELKSMRQ